MTSPKRGFPWLIVILSVVLVAVIAVGAVLVINERDRADQEKNLAKLAQQRLEVEKRKTAEAERRAAEAERRAKAAAQGAGTSGGSSGGGGIAGFRGRRVWFVTKSRPAKDYCAILKKAGLVVRCGYNRNKVNLHVLILRCPNLTESKGRALMRYLGLNLRVNNWQRENQCGKYHEITVYLND